MNFYCLGMIEAIDKNLSTLKRMQPKTKQIMCTECINEIALIHCVQCNAAFCDDCRIRMHSGRVGKSHQTTDINTSSFQFINGYCEQHNGKRYVEYCKKCEKHLCNACIDQHNEAHGLSCIKRMVSVYVCVREFIFYSHFIKATKIKMVDERDFKMSKQTLYTNAMSF